MKKRLGLVGFFGWGNFGDELFIRAHLQYLSDLATLHQLPDLTEKPYFSRPIEQVLEGIDGIVIGGGDLLIPWQLSALYWRIEFLDKPVFVVGVGVPTWQKPQPSVIAHYRRFLSHPNVKLIAARDPESAEWIRRNIAPEKTVEWYPDLVCALDLPEAAPVDKKKARQFGIVVRQRRGDDDFTQVRNLADRAQSYGFTPVHIVLANMDTGRRDNEVAQRLAKPDEQIVYSEDLDVMCRAIASCEMIASMKFHGTVVATMYGVPSVVLSPTDKSRNFIRLIERPDLLSSFTHGNLPDRVPHFPVSIPSHSRKFLRESSAAGYQRLRAAVSESLA